MEKLSQQQSNRNVTFDLFKLLAAYMVVFIHNKFYGDLGLAIEAVARFAVPLFFVSSGFFCFGNTPDRIKLKAFRIAKMFLWATVMYHIVNIGFYVLQSKTDEIVPYIKGMFEFNTIWQFFLTNLPYSSTPLWFLLALIYTYIVHYFVVKFKVPHKIMLVISCVIIAAEIVMWEFMPAFGIVIPAVTCFLTLGYPFFTLGLCFRKNKDRLVNIRTWILVLMLVLGIIQSISSRLLYERFELYNGEIPSFMLPLQHITPPVPELFLGSVAVVFALVVISMKYPSVQCPDFLIKLTACSTYIYIFHRLCGMVIVKGLKFVGVNTDTALITNIITISVCVLSTVVAILIIQLESFIKKKRIK